MQMQRPVVTMAKNISASKLKIIIFISCDDYPREGWTEDDMKTAEL